MSEPTRTGELTRLRENGSMTIEELREFTAKFKGRSPAEMLGVVASSGLFRSLVVATLGCIVVIGVCTAGPYYLAKWRGDDAATATAKTQPTPATPAAAAPTNPAAPTGTPSVATDTPAGADPETAADRMGINETKTAPADANPLDNDLDKLLDGVE